MLLYFCALGCTYTFLYSPFLRTFLSMGIMNLWFVLLETIEGVPELQQLHWFHHPCGKSDCLDANSKGFSFAFLNVCFLSVLVCFPFKRMRRRWTGTTILLSINNLSFKADGLTRFNASDPTLSACLFDITFSLWYICYKLSYFPCQYQVRLVPILKLDFFSMFKVVLYCTRCNWMSWCSLKTVTIETFLPIFQTHISNLTNSTVHAPI